MKNRLITVAFMAFFMASTIQLVTAQVYAATIPCKEPRDCQTDGFPEKADCESSACVCPGPEAGSARRYCTLEDLRKKSADTPPPASSSSSTETSAKTLSPASRTVATDAMRCPTPCPEPYGFCNSTRKQCDCEEGFVMAVNNTECLAVAFGLGSNCTEKEQCEKLMGYATCEDKQCVCQEGYHETGSSECRKNLKLGEKCDNTKDCSHVFGAVCDPALGCKCLAEMTANEDGDKCLSIAHNYFDPCEEKSQCLAKIPNSICVDNKCRCEEKYHFNITESACLFHPSLGGDCQKDYECDQDEEEGATRFQLCQDNICTCQPPFYRNGDFCTDGAASLVPGLLSVLAAVFLFSRG